MLNCIRYSKYVNDFKVYGCFRLYQYASIPIFFVYLNFKVLL